MKLRVAPLTYLLVIAGACSSDPAPAPGATPTPTADAGAIPPAADAATTPAPPPFDWVGIIGTGQSLSVGARGEDFVSTMPSYKNQKLVDTGPDPKYPLDGGAPQLALVPLVEPIRTNVLGKGPGYNDAQYPNNIFGETPHSGMASEISSLFAARGAGDYVSIHSVVGWSGHPLVDIDKAGGQRAYPASMIEARAIQALAKSAGKTFGYGAVILTHGESDAGTPTYGAGLKTFIDDYNTDLKAITGQSRDVVLLVSQQSTNAGPVSSAVQVWAAGVANPARIVCTGPKYQYGYADDHLHLPAAGYRRLGEKYGEIFDIVVNQGKPWAPLQPKAAVRSGAKIVVTFDVPNPPIAWDTTLTAPHLTANAVWSKGHGFEVSKGATKLGITSAEITGPDAVTLTLSADPGAPVVVGYATVEDVIGNQGGLPVGYRGQLRDSDELVGFDEQTIKLALTKGSAVANVVGDVDLSARALRDVVTGTGVPAGWTVLEIASTTRMTMSEPWTGDASTVTVSIHHDLHNYAVHASLPAP